MAIVEEYMIGNTRIIICDDAYKDKTPEELEKIKHISFLGRKYYLRKEGEKKSADSTGANVPTC